MTDVLIAGGGIAGSALAILLGRRGLSVELYERGTFPREKACGEGLMPGGVGVLERLGLADTAGGAEFRGVRYHFGEQTAEGRFPQTNGVPAAGRGLRRRHLDRLLFEAAATTPGATVHTGTRVGGPLIEGGRVTGLSVEGNERRARLVVAADGVHSTLRHTLGLHRTTRRLRFGVRAHFRLARGTSQPGWVDVFAYRDHELYVTPLPQNEVLVAALADARGAVEPAAQSFERWRRGPRVLAERLDGAEQVSELAGTSPLAGSARRGFVPGAVLLGDAAGFLDPITGGGMTQALMSAELLARHLRNGVPAGDDWLVRFDCERRTMLRDYRMLTRTVLWLSDHPRLTERVLALLGDSPQLFSHLVGVSGGVRRLMSPFSV